jgi:hypothetical protein
MTNIKNITELRDRTLAAFEKLEKDPRAYNQCGELANIAGKVISSTKVQLEYASLRKEKPEIPFLNCEK